MEQSGRENVVAHKHTHLVVIDGVDRSLAASFGAFIDHIVVHQRRRVQQLQTYGCMLGYLGNGSETFGYQQDENGSHALAAALADMVQGLRQHAILVVERAVEHLDEIGQFCRYRRLDNCLIIHDYEYFVAKLQIFSVII